MFRNKTYEYKEPPFEKLMSYRINKVLVVCSRYDFFMLEADGRIDEQIYIEYVSLNLRYPPIFLHAETIEEAYSILEKDEISLIIPMLSIRDVDTFQFSKEVKEKHPQTPIVVLTHFSRDVSQRLQQHDLSSIDYIFSWLGNTDIFLAIIKMIEDKMNAQRDILQVGVQCIILVEDSVRYISTYLPELYKIILEQSKLFSREALNEHQQFLRRRARPKILLAQNLKDAVGLFLKYRNNVLGIISDVCYKSSPTQRDTKAKAGLILCQIVKSEEPTLPVLLQSSDIENKDKALDKGAGFIHKYSLDLHTDLKEYILNNFGFGDLVFKESPNAKEIIRVSSLTELQQNIHLVPDDVFKTYANREEVSRWLNARALFPIANQLKSKNIGDFKDIATAKQFVSEAIKDFRVNKARGIIAEFKGNNTDEFAMFARIGEGNMGGKGRGLAFINHILQNSSLSSKYEKLEIKIPPTLVIGTSVYESFLEANKIEPSKMVELPDEEVLQTFINGTFPAAISDELKSLAQLVKKPIAIRSSSKLEDSHYQPFAGVYNTYMLPVVSNKLYMASLLEQAIKSVYASVFFSNSIAYLQATSNLIDEEKMGVVIQQITGNEYGELYYPEISGVARSINHYTIGNEQYNEGIAELALGLGKQVVGGDTSLRFSPKHPKHILQTSTVELALRDTQKSFYALDCNIASFKPSVYDGINLKKLRINDAADIVLQKIASTYNADRGVLSEGPFQKGKKVLTFSPVLKHESLPLAKAIQDVLNLASEAMNTPVEIEFSLTYNTPDYKSAIFNILQVRPISKEQLQVKIPEIKNTEHAIIRTNNLLGHGNFENIKTLVIVDIETYSAQITDKVISELQEINKVLIEEKSPYLLIGPGRWGSSDKSLGIPVEWSQISGAQVLVEVNTKRLHTEPSQGSHFFHNITSLGVGYLSVDTLNRDHIYKLNSIESLSIHFETSFVKVFKAENALTVALDALNKRGIVTL